MPLCEIFFITGYPIENGPWYTPHTFCIYFETDGKENIRKNFKNDFGSCIKDYIVPHYLENRPKGTFM